MTPSQRDRLANLLRRGCGMPAARDLAETMLRVDDRRALTDFPPSPHLSPSAGCGARFRGALPRRGAGMAPVRTESARLSNFFACAAIILTLLVALFA